MVVPPLSTDLRALAELLSDLSPGERRTLLDGLDESGILLGGPSTASRARRDLATRGRVALLRRLVRRLLLHLSEQGRRATVVVVRNIVVVRSTTGRRLSLVVLLVVLLLLLLLMVVLLLLLKLTLLLLLDVRSGSVRRSREIQQVLSRLILGAGGLELVLVHGLVVLRHGQRHCMLSGHPTRGVCPLSERRHGGPDCLFDARRLSAFAGVQQ